MNKGKREFMVYTMTDFLAVENPTRMIKQCMLDSDIHLVAVVDANSNKEAIEKGKSAIQSRIRRNLKVGDVVLTFNNTDEMLAFINGVQLSERISNEEKQKLYDKALRERDPNTSASERIDGPGGDGSPVS
jgi:hypothetical protein